MKKKVIEEDDSAAIDISKDDDELTRAKTERVERTKEHGSDEMIKAKLKKIIDEEPNLFRVRLVADPPAKVTPMKVHLKKDAAHNDVVLDCTLLVTPTFYVNS